MKKIQTTRFGEIEVGDDHVIHFKDGMIGFSKLKEYTLIESPGMPLILWLQSVDEPDIAFPLVEPYFFKKDYKVNLSDSDKHSLGFQEGDRQKLLTVMTIPENMTQMTVNLKAPVVVDINRSSGAQIIMQDRSLEVRTPAFEHFNRAVTNFSIEQSAQDVPVPQEKFNPINVRSAGTQGFLATV